MNNVILVCVSIILPMVLVIANRLLDRTSSKEKDSTISELTQKVSDLTKGRDEDRMRTNAATEAAGLAKGNADSTVKAADLMKEAVQVGTLEEAIELARRQAQQ